MFESYSRVRKKYAECEGGTWGTGPANPRQRAAALRVLLRGGLPSDAAHFEHVDHVVHALFGGRPDALRQEDRRVD